MENLFISKVKSELAARKAVKVEILKESDIAHLPAPVRKYIAYSGAIGKPIPYNFRLEFEAQMYSKPGASAMEATSVQYNFFGEPSRLFFMKASKMLVPIRVFHCYQEYKATMVVRVASLFNAVDLSGEELSTGETVTILNDICFFAPGRLIDKKLTWTEIDNLTCKVTFENGPYKVSGILYFNEKGELINFTSENRGALQDDGTIKRYKWSTPCKNYKEINGMKHASYGEATYHYPEGDFIYGKFWLKDVKYNVKEYKEE